VEILYLKCSFQFRRRYGEQAGRVTGDAMGAVGNAVEVDLNNNLMFFIFLTFLIHLLLIMNSLWGKLTTV
jgi:hypothetical protein